MSRVVIGRFALLWLVASTFAIAGCGKKGPLYLPDAAAYGVLVAIAPHGS